MSDNDEFSCLQQNSPAVEFLIATMGTTCLGKCFLSIQFLPQLVEKIKQTRQQLASYGLRMQPDVVVKKKKLLLNI